MLHCSSEQGERPNHLNKDATMTSNFDQFSNFGKDNIDALIKSGTIVAQGFEDLAKVYSSIASQTVEQTSSALKAFAAAKNPAEFQTVFNSVAKQNLDSFVASSRKVQEISTTILSSSIAPLTGRFQQAASAAGPKAGA